MKTMSTPLRSPLLLMTTLVCVLSFIVSAYLIYSYIDHQREITQLSKQTIIEQARQAAKEIGNRKAVIQPAVEDLVNELGGGVLGYDRIGERLREIYLSYEDTIFEVGVAFNPDNPCTPGEMHAPHYARKGGSPAHFALEDYYDPPYPEWPWYRQTISKGARWIEPYLGGATREVVVGFASPFYCPGDREGQGEPAGVARANLSLTDIRARLVELRLGRTGYGFILSGEGTYIAHPVAAQLYALENIYDRDDVKQNPDLRNFIDRGLAGQEELIDFTDPESGMSSWLVLTAVPGTNWHLGAVFFKHEVADSVTGSRRQLILITTTLIIFFSSLVFLFSGAYRGGIRSLWFGGSVATASLFVAGLVVVCFLALKMPSNDDRLEIRVMGPAGAQTFLTTNAAKQRRQIVRAEAPIYVPTGILIQSVEFATSNNVILTGYIWQKYDSTIGGDISRGFVLPEAESLEIEEAYSRPSDGGRVIGWYFKATLRQSFDYTAYPLDRQNLWVRIWHKDFDRNVILTPDFESYDYTNPVRLPGLDLTDFVLPGWSIAETYFSFRENNYSSNFGIEDYVGQLDFPELYFNIELVRHFVDPFISHIVPLLAIVIMVFAVLIYGTRKREEAVELGFDASTVLSILAAFFFTIVIAHVTLRSRLNAEAVVYIEWFHLIMYVVILSVSINSLLFTSVPKTAFLGKFIHSQDNLWPKLFYWPVIMGLLFGITVYVFY
jgi:hypothetical protein